MTPASNGPLLQLVHDHRDQAQKAHDRVRVDVNGLGQKVSGLQTVQTDILLRLQKIELVPVNVEKVTFSSTQLVVIVSACLAMAVGMWTLRVGINDLQTTVANTAKLQDERNQSSKEQMQDLNQKMELRRIEIQNLSNKLSEFMLQKGRP